MLTRELAIAEYKSGQIIPDRLTQPKHSHYVALIDQVLELYRNGIDRTRGDLHSRVQQIFGEELECPVRRIGAFCKLMDEKASYDRDRRGDAAKLRKEVFRLAAASHPLVQRTDRLFESSETEVKKQIAEKLGTTWTDIHRRLFADVIPFHRLREFEGYASAKEFLSRYNVAQCQAVLYDSVSMNVWAGDDFKSVLRYAKLARLMHTIQRQSDGSYRFRFDGPSSVLRESRRYGVAMAKFLPSLLACRDWKMQAVIRHRRSNWTNRFVLTPADGLTSNLANHEDFDSSLEEKFAARWGDGSREGWTMIREGEVLHHDQKVFIPDFVFQHESGQRVLLEIVGFWTPEYLAAKRQTLETFRGHQILLAVAERLDWPGTQIEGTGINADGETADLIRYKTSIRVQEVLDRLQQRLKR